MTILEIRDLHVTVETGSEGASRPARSCAAST